MALTQSAPAAAQKASVDLRAGVRLWLIAVAGLIFLMVLVGGATRLTESRPLDHPMEARHRSPPAAERRGVAGGVRPLQADPAIRQAQSGHDARRLPDDLLLGMGPPPAGARRRRGLHPSGPMVLAERALQGRARPSGRGRDGLARARTHRRLVDGDLGTERAHRGRAGAAGAASDDRRRDFRRPDLRRGRAERTPALRHGAARVRDLGAPLRGARLLPARARRPGRGPARRPDLQHLAVDGIELDSRRSVRAELACKRC